MPQVDEVIRVGIVDDSRAIVTSLGSNLNYASKMRVVLTAGDGNTLLEKLRTCAEQDLPQVMITDVNMPGMSGIEIVRRGKALYPKMKFLMLTVADDEDTLFDAIQAGASGYLMKDEPIRGIIDHIERLMMSGSVPMSPRMARKTLEILARSDKTWQTEGSPADAFDLSNRELQVLNLLVDGLDYKAIAKELIISPNTVRKHISNVYDKLHVSSKAQAIRLMQGTPKRHERRKDVTCKIVLTDDHQIILDSLSMMISTVPEMQVIGKINDSRKVTRFLTDHHADVLITDISMPFLDGLQLTETVHNAFPDLKILILTVSEDVVQMRRARAVGAHGYVLKKAGKDELTNAIRSVMRGETYFSDAMLAS